MKAENVNSEKEYRQYIKELADSIEKEYHEYNDNDIYGNVHNTVDSSRMIMFYSNNLIVLEYSTNEPSEWKGLVGENAHWKDVIQTMAFDVMRKDLYEELEERDIEF